MRTAVARSNISVNKAAEAKYFYQDLDESGSRLNGGKRYTVTFPTGQVPPVKGFGRLRCTICSISLYPMLSQAVLNRHEEQRPETKQRWLLDDLRAG
jgi:Protein of unknown function (DUF1214)